MNNYKLIYTDDGVGAAQTIEFDSHGPGAALSIADRQAANRSAELWSERGRLCTIRRSEAGYWAVQ